MKLLLFVLTLLLVTASLSYQALQKYESNRTIRISWNDYIKYQEPCNFNSQVLNEYRILKRTQGKAGTDEEKEKAKAGEEQESEGTATINYRYLIDPKYQTQFPASFELMRSVFKKLIVFLYQDTEFYKKWVGDSPNGFDELFTLLLESQKDEKQKVTNVDGLAKVQLGDPRAQAFWYEILKDTYPTPQVISVLFPKENDYTDEELACVKISFSKYLNKRQKHKIRLYLAPRAILFALLEDEALVKQFVDYRNSLYNEARKKDKKEFKALAEEFKAFSSKFPTLEEYGPILDYSVTTTNPKDYLE